jgi:hypothetical protein
VSQAKSMREKGIEPLRQKQAADPKTAPSPSAAPTRANLAKRDSTTLHHVTPGITEHVIPGRTSRRSRVVSTVPCAWCEKPFTTDRLDVIRCSLRCARAAYLASWRCRRELEGAA